MVTGINRRIARAAGLLQIVSLSSMRLSLAVVIVLIPIAFGRAEPVALTPFPAAGLSLTTVSASAIFTLWALLGFESASVAAAKVDRPATTIPPAAMIGTPPKHGRDTGRERVGA